MEIGTRVLERISEPRALSGAMPIFAWIAPRRKARGGPITDPMGAPMFKIGSASTGRY
jgi:hypothetical protein